MSQDTGTFSVISYFFSTGNEANFRTAAYEAITSYLTHATVDAIPVVQNTVVTILQRMEQLLGMQVRHVIPLLQTLSHD